MDIKTKIKEAFWTNGGKLLLKTKNAKNVLDRSKDWMDLRVKKGDGVQYIEFGYANNAEKRYRLDHCVCYAEGVNVLPETDIVRLFSELLVQKYGKSPSRSQMLSILSMSSGTYLKFIKQNENLVEGAHPNTANLPSGRQYVDKGSYMYQVDGIVEGVLKMQTIKTKIQKQK